MKFCNLVLSIMFFTTCSSVALANEANMSIEEIQKQLKALSSQVEMLTKVVEEQSQVIKKQEAALQSKDEILIENIDEHIDQKIERHVVNLNIPQKQKSFTDEIKITKDPTPKFETTDGRFSFQPFGRVHLDATFFDNDKSDNNTTTSIRRARFGFKGKIGENLEYKSDMDFSEDEADIQDMTLTYTGLESADLTIGHHRPPVGFERNTSSNHNMMIERAVPTNLFSSNRKIGASISTKSDDYAFGVGAYTQDAGGNGNNDNDEDFSIDARAATNVLKLYDDKTDNVLHVGAGYSYQKPSDAVRFRARPGIGDGARFVDTGNIPDVDTINIANAELVGLFGPLSFQGEYFNTSLDGGGDANFDGYYAQLGYFLTGEERNYNPSRGLFGRTRVLRDFSLSNSGLGAWEVSARYDSTNLSDSSAGITGGELDLYTLGLNWYLNKNVRLMNNVIFVNSDDNAATVPDDDPTIFKMRAQWDF